MTDTLDTRSLESTVDKYLAAWTEVDSGKRAAMVSDVWADNGRLVDPPLTATGHDGIREMAATMQSQFPAHPMAERVVPEFRRSATGLSGCVKSSETPTLGGDPWTRPGS